MSRLSLQRSRPWPVLVLAVLASAGLHAALLAPGNHRAPERTLWSRIEARLSVLPLTDPRLEPEPVRTPASVVASDPAPPAALAQSAPLQSDPAGPGLVLPSAFRALYRRSDGKERELIWRLDQDHYVLRWRDDEGASRAEGGLGWSGLGEGALPEAALAFQVAVMRQWLSPDVRRSGWWVLLENGARLRVVEIASGARPAYRIEGVSKWRTLELDAKRGYLPVGWSEAAAPELPWRLVWLEDLARE